MEATAQNPLSFFKIKKNVSTLERLLMVTGGAYILYNSLVKKNKSLKQTSLGSTMLLRGVAGYCPVYDAVDTLKNGKVQNVNIRINNVINKPVSEVYAFWRDLENLPKFMYHLESVKSLNNRISQWTAKVPGGISELTWRAEIIKDEKDKLLCWHSLPDSSVENAGKVIFKSKGKATELDITISYRAPLGKVGEIAAQVFNPFFEKKIRDDIDNLKTYLESNYDKDYGSKFHK